MAEHLDQLDRKGIPWGVVTNKSQRRFAIPLMEELALRQRSVCIVCGDSAQRAKPHIHPMQLASAVIGIDAGGCIYVGDDERDVISGRAAGMKTVVAGWGYWATANRPVTGGPTASRSRRRIFSALPPQTGRIVLAIYGSGNI